MNQTKDDDRFERLARGYDRWIGWSARLGKEMPFLLETLNGRQRVLDVGAGTGMHALALADKGFQVTAIDSSAAMLEQARTQPGAEKVEWVETDITQPDALGQAKFDAILSVGNVILAMGDEETIETGLTQMLRLLAPGGSLLLQYLNVVRIRESGRLVVKSAGEGEEEQIWLRHHFGPRSGQLRNHSYVLTRTDGKWQVDLQCEDLADVTPERIETRLRPEFETIELFEGLTGRPFDRLESDAIGLVAAGRR